MEKEFITWKEPIYLLQIPFLMRVSVCNDDSCGRKSWVWRKKGIIKIREIEHTREKTLIDKMGDLTTQYYKDKLMYRAQVAVGNTGEKIILRRPNASG